MCVSLCECFKRQNQPGFSSRGVAELYGDFIMNCSIQWFGVAELTGVHHGSVVTAEEKRKMSLFNFFIMGWGKGLFLNTAVKAGASPGSSTNLHPTDLASSCFLSKKLRR